MAEFKNIQKGQLKEILAKQCSACGNRGYNRSSCPNKNEYCHSYNDLCCDKMHLIGNKDFPCSGVCSLCEKRGHLKDKCQLRCNRCYTDEVHEYGDQDFDCGKKCELCSRKGHNQENCSNRCNTPYCAQEPHLYKDTKFTCGETSCRLCQRTNHLTYKCRSACTRCTYTDLHMYRDPNFNCGRVCNTCGRTGHSSLDCYYREFKNTKPKVISNDCYAEWCDNKTVHIFGTYGFACGEPCNYCNETRHLPAKCNTLCRMKTCDRVNIHKYKDELYLCGKS
jgi:hypothetical protein